jgi:hypothetical protein
MMDLKKGGLVKRDSAEKLHLDMECCISKREYERFKNRLENPPEINITINTEALNEENIKKLVNELKRVRVIK